MKEDFYISVVALPYEIGIYMVHASMAQLRKAFQYHRQPALVQVSSRNLLLFYAVECGLKAAWLSRNRLSSTSEMDLESRAIGHDLRAWTRKLCLPASVTTGTAGFRLRAGTSRLEIAVLHQAWRYGVGIEPSDEAEIETWLEQVWQWAKGELHL